MEREKKYRSGVRQVPCVKTHSVNNFYNNSSIRQFSKLCASVLVPNTSSTKQPTSYLITAVHMVSEQTGYEGNAQRRGSKVALDKSATILQSMNVQSLS